MIKTITESEILIAIKNAKKPLNKFKKPLYMQKFFSVYAELLILYFSF